MLTPGIIYLRLSEFRDANGLTFDAREEELRELAADLGVMIRGDARIENDVDPVTKRIKGASAYKTPRRVQTSTGQVEFRTHRPVFQSVVLELQDADRPMVLFVGDASRIARNERDALDLIDAARVSGASVVAPDEEGGARWILTDGGTPAEVSAFKDRMSDARKYSDDLSAKLRRGRRRWAGKSYHGGMRPFGYRVKHGTEEPRATSYPTRQRPRSSAKRAMIYSAASVLRQSRGTSATAASLPCPSSAPAPRGGGARVRNGNPSLSGPRFSAPPSPVSRYVTVSALTRRGQRSSPKTNSSG